MLSLLRLGETLANIAGMIAKYFATSLAMEKVVSAPRVIRSCLPISTISISFVGLESRSTMFPASLAAEVPVFMATPTSAWASAGASLVPSPVIATSFPPSCSFLIRAILSSGVASARKSSTPASSAMAAAVSGLSPVIMTVGCPWRRRSSKRSLDALLDDVLEVDHAERPRRGVAALLGDDERGAAAVGDPLDHVRRARRRCAAVVADPVRDRAGRALAERGSAAVGQVHAATSGSGR